MLKSLPNQIVSIIMGLWICGTVTWNYSKADEVLPEAYPAPELLIELDQLAKEISSPKLVLLDARENAEYQKGHLPRAVWVDAAAWGKAVTVDTEAEPWTKRFSELGTDTDSVVVIYDNQRQRNAARVWWILKLWGVSNAKLLNGGWTSRTESEGRPQQDASVAPKRGNINAQRQANAIATKVELLEGLKTPGKGLQLVDTRSKEEHCGINEARTKNKGTIPGSKHLEWSDLLIPETARFRPPAEIAKLFSDAGIDVQKPSATYCQGGGRASVTAFVLALMGSPEARN